jgi:L-cysteine:1D-myo-inositol 2-amino-2-deoxy-alpha-D-glucopyranoside ligase
VPRLSVVGLPAAASELRVHDTSAHALRPTRPGPIARMYVCGITPYDATHLGHAATYVAFDLVNRFWRDAGHEVLYVQNVTDVDDPLLERAFQTGEDWERLAEREIALFREDMTELRVLPPDEFIGAVEAIPLIVDMIEVLRGNGAAYDVDGDIYFPISADSRFGQVSGLTRAEMLPLFAERGGDPDRPGKKDPLDALLWLAARPGEPAWDSPFGPGRPGWHVECAAISLRHLGMAFDVEGGGSDLAFPHHEMGASHAQVATGEQPHARAYVHAGMVGLDGEKMSKSKGNLVFVSRLLAEGADPMAIRLALLAHHYRSDWEWTAAELDRATERLSRWRAAVRLPAGRPAAPLLDEVRRT